MNHKGFTVGEAMVIVTIVGVLGALGVPKFITAVEGMNVEKQEQELVTVYQAQLSFFQDVGRYATSLGELDVVDNASSNGSSHYTVLYDGGNFGSNDPNCKAIANWVAKTMRSGSGLIKSYELAITDEGSIFCAPCESTCQKLGFADADRGGPPSTGSEDSKGDGVGLPGNLK